MKLKWLMWLETFLIIILAVFLIFTLIQNSKIEKAKEGHGLLSPRVYAGLLAPKNHLIFNFDPLKVSLANYIEDNSLNVSVYVLNLRDGAWIGINEEKLFNPASLNKVLLAILVMRKIEKGELNFGMTIPINEADRDPNDLNPINESKIILRQAFERMLKESDNTAFAALRNYITINDTNPFIFYFDYYKKDLSSGKNGQTQPELVNVQSIANVFSSLYFSTLLEPENSEYVLSLLTENVFNVKSTSNLPEDVRVAHKFGDRYSNNLKEFSDCGILYIDDSRVFYCVITNGLETEKAIDVISLVVNSIYTYVDKVKSNFKDTKL